ncbi:MAG TPA: hypothetical protein PLW24_15180 [Burkholderiaceae bacterium]|nr:hypothetical protein [Burkholderiaceae bacterium]
MLLALIDEGLAAGERRWRCKILPFAESLGFGKKQALTRVEWPSA